MEKKGLFGRLLDFWMEKIGGDETKGIGFWNGAESRENSFAETRDAISLRQGERKQTFWEEKAEIALGEKERNGGFLERERKFFFAEGEQKQKEALETGEEGAGATEERERTEEAEGTEKRKVSRLFTATVFREERQAEGEESKMGRTFLWETPEGEKERRRIVPMAEPAKEEKGTAAEEERETAAAEAPKKEAIRTETPFDIEKLMQQITKRLWEERESCGRRLRG